MLDIINGLTTLVSTAANPSAIIVAAIVGFLLWFVYSKEKRSEDRAVKFDKFLETTTEQQAVTGRILGELVRVVSELGEAHKENCAEFKSSHKDLHRRLDTIDICSKEVGQRLDELDDDVKELKTEIHIRSSQHGDV